MKCLDSSELDAAKVEEQGADYVDKLNGIFTWLSSESTDNPQRFDRETAEQEPGPDVKAKMLGHNPALITLVERADGQWVFLLNEAPRLDTSSPQATRIFASTASRRRYVTRRSRSASVLWPFRARHSIGNHQGHRGHQERQVLVFLVPLVVSPPHDIRVRPRP